MAGPLLCHVACHQCFQLVGYQNQNYPSTKTTCGLGSGGTGEDPQSASHHISLPSVAFHRGVFCCPFFVSLTEKLARRARLFYLLSAWQRGVMVVATMLQARGKRLKGPHGLV
eukprot:scaffold10501_cov141-Amphora_coffeaeformis.AAC.4